MTRLPLTPLVPLRDPAEEEASLLARLGAPVLGGLAKVGNLLDVPGSMVRDFLAGENAFDQLLHPLSHSERGLSTGGRDLLSRYGMRPNEETGLRGWFSDPGEAVRDIAGFGAEVALDPLFWLPAGSLAKGAKAAAGAAPVRRAAEAIESTRLGRLARENVIDPLTDRAMAAFSAPVMGQMGRAERALGRGVTAARHEAGAEAFSRGAPLIEEFSKHTAGLEGEDLYRAWSAMEDAIEERATGLHKSDVAKLPPEMAGLQGVRDAARGRYDKILKEAQAGGLKLSDVNDIYEQKYGGRRRIFSPNEDRMLRGGQKGVTGYFGEQIKREEQLRDILGSTGLIKELSVDPRFSGVAHRIRPDRLDEAFWKSQRKSLSDALGQADLGFEKTDELAKWLAHLDPWHVDNKIPAFLSDPVETLVRRDEVHGTLLAMNRIARKTIAPAAKRAGDAGITPDHVPVSQLFDELGFDSPRSMELLRGDLGIKSAAAAAKAGDDATGMIVRVPDSDRYGTIMKASGDDMTVRFTDPKTGAQTSKVYNVTDLTQVGRARNLAHDEFFVPREVAQRLKNISQAYRSTDEVAEKIFAPLKAFTQLWKAGVTGRPAFQPRNLMSGQFFNFINDMWSARSVRAAAQLVQGREINNVPWEKLGTKYQGLGNREATRKFAQEAFSQRVAERRQGIAALDDVPVSRNLAADIPGLQPITARSVFRPGGSLNPLDAEEFSWFKGSRRAGEWVEGMNRLAPYLELRLRGVAPKEAAARVRAGQIDYSDLTRFEREYIRPWVPFYGFSKGIAKKVSQELLDKPGGKLAQTLRFQHSASAQELPLPAYVGQTGAIPYSQSEDGTKSYVTSLGLMHEDPLQLLGGGVAELASRLSPVAKVPIELATGKSLFQRGPLGARELTEADPTLGRLATNLGLQEQTGGRAEPLVGVGFEHVMANMPFSPLANIARTLTDERKGWLDKLLNTTTGVRISSVSPEAQSIAIQQHQDRLARDLLGAESFQRTYIPRDEQARLAEDPRTADQLLAYRQLSRKLDRDNRDRKRQRERAQQGQYGGLQPLDLAAAVAP